MSNPYAFYLSYMHDQTGYRATWEPGKTLQLGQIGKLDSYGVFSVYSSLADEGIPMTVVTKDNEGGDMDYTSNDSVTITTKLAGTAPTLGSTLGEADAGVTIEFRNSKSIVFQSTGNKTDYISNLGQVTNQILEKYRNKNWDKNWLVITELSRAESATIIISNSANGSLDLKAKAAVGTAGLKLTDASLGLTVAREKGSTLKYISQTGLTPLYRVHGIVDPWFGNASVQTKAVLEKPIAADDFVHRDLTAEELEEND